MFCALTQDASTYGWAALARWRDISGPAPVLREPLLVGTWPAGRDVSKQPFREAPGGALAFEAFAQAVATRGPCCILRNDAVAATAAFREGCTLSPQTQLCALRLPRAAACGNVDYLSGHVPSLVLAAEGIQVVGASRSGPDMGRDANVGAVLGPAAVDPLWRAIRTAAADAGWGRVTVDAFASAANARTSRFWSRFLEPGAEAVDALSVLDWAQSPAPSAGRCIARSSTHSLHWPSCGRLWRRLSRTARCASSSRGLCAGRARRLRLRLRPPRTPSGAAPARRVPRDLRRAPAAPVRGGGRPAGPAPSAGSVAGTAGRAVVGGLAGPPGVRGPGIEVSPRDVLVCPY